MAYLDVSSSDQVRLYVTGHHDFDLKLRNFLFVWHQNNNSSFGLGFDNIKRDLEKNLLITEWTDGI